MRYVIDSVPGGIVTIAHGDQQAVDANGVRRRATTRKVRRLLCRKIISRYGTLNTDGSQGPTEAIYGRGFNDK